MAVLGLDHVNVRTADPERTLGFFRDVLGMKVAPPPGMAAVPGGGGWVYDSDDRPVVHVGTVETPYPTDGAIRFEASRGGGAVHHVALNCSDFEGMKDRLRSRELDFTENLVSRVGLRQLFVAEPNGILLELNFRGGA